jgi:hypothetical protein
MEIIFFAIIVIVFVLGILKAVKMHVEKTTARVIRKGEMVNTERNSWIKFRIHGGGANINLNWVVVFQEIDSGREIELEVSGSNYDALKIGQTGTLYYRWGTLKNFEKTE